jgi:hypothetical protein
MIEGFHHGIVLAFAFQCGVTVDIKVYAQIKAFSHEILHYFAIVMMTLHMHVTVDIHM